MDNQSTAEIQFESEKKQQTEIVYGVFENQKLYWGRKEGYHQVRYLKVKQQIDNVINISCTVFTVIGILMLFWTLWPYFESGDNFWFFWEIRSLPMLVFWLSIITIMFVYYRFSRQLEKINKYTIPYNTITSFNDKMLSADTTQNIVPIDISKYFTLNAQQTVADSWKAALSHKDAEVAPIHLFISMLSNASVNTVFARLNITWEKLRNRVGSVLAQVPTAENRPFYLSISTQQMLIRSYINAKLSKSSKVDVIDILEAMVATENEITEMLFDMAITKDKLTNTIAWIKIRKKMLENWRRFRQKAGYRPKNKINRAMTAIATPTLDAFSRDITLLAQMGYFLPCIGRQQELEGIIAIMQGGQRKSPLLVGEEGIGKKTIIEGLAQRMVSEDVPSFLQDKRLVALDVARLTSGVGIAGAQERLLRIINEIRRSGNIILYIPNIHNLVGLSAGAEAGIDLADVFAQLISQTDLIAIGTITPASYRRFIENRSTLEGVFNVVQIKESRGNEAIQILESKVGSIEYKHNVYFTYDSIEALVELSDRYMYNRKLPEKAIEIMEEVAAVTSRKGKGVSVTANDVASVISQKTNIPLTEITEEESEKLLNLESRIHQRVVSQHEAVTMVATSLRRARAEIRDTKRPIVNLLFLGPTGVGKTEVAKTVAEVYFNSEKNMIRLDMSEYQDQSSLPRLIGTAGSPGYLTEAVKKNPFTLVLLDEFEKANSDILNIFLQIMDDGRLTGDDGRTVDFTNTIIIATSNAGSMLIQNEIRKGQDIESIKKELLETELNKYFRPELINRFDGIAVFKPLSSDDVRQIALLMVSKLKEKLEDKGIELLISERALEQLAEEGYHPEYGARALRRVIQQRIEDKIAEILIANQVSRRDAIVITDLDNISIEKAKALS